MFAALMRLSGMSVAEAALYFGVTRRVIQSWNRKTAPPPEGTVEKLYALIAAQEAAAEEIIDAWDAAGQPATHRLRVAATDEEAQASGWPSVSAQMVPIAMAQATLTRVDIDIVQDVKTEEEAES